MWAVSTEKRKQDSADFTDREKSGHKFGCHRHIKPDNLSGFDSEFEERIGYLADVNVKVLIRL